jgi:phosphoribosylformylglycinamidine synthase I
MFKVAMIVFSGTNCDDETSRLLKKVTGNDPINIWHKETELPKVDLYVLPGGFSYGDYMRSGSLASLSPIISELKKRSDEDRKIIGICNGFQILCESKLLPGTLRKNKNLKFICRHVTVNDKNNSYTIPIAHGEGNYYHPNPFALNVAYRYTEDVNGSVNNIAGIYNEKNNVLGMMPHPERAFEDFHSSKDGYKIIDNFLNL